ncbi:Nitroreductase [Pedobacter westerhofensis]|uniref:Nitroreductase n=1 Tax=Pedobacter westerhofensis TaxID=425512 RepID=A0A521FMP1_9SPHI|nr:NAD(P)H-dependent oxidoreductase [Pedobacter westerhofensis]SMO96850.1 Nitroreductase [Pedobacter westerhofensis]
MSLLDKLEWRYATKKFDSTKKIPADQLNQVLEAIRLAPSSYGLQQFRLLVVSDHAIREKLAAAAWNQPQLLEASHVLVFAAETKLDTAFVDANIELTAKVRNIGTETLAGWKNMIGDGIKLRSNGDVLVHWAQKQAYIGLGIAISVAAELGLDSCPMEGFDPEEFDQILGLKEKNLTATVILPVGYRSEDDGYIQLAKVRRPADEFFIAY